MFKQLPKTFKVIYKYIPVQAIIMMIVELFCAIFPSISLILSQNLINNVENFLYGNNDITSVIVTIAIMVICILIIECRPPIIVVLIISARRKLNKTFSKDILNKFKRLDYFCFEDSKTQDLLKRMGDNYHEKYLEEYQNYCNIISKLIGLITLCLILLQVSIWAVITYIICVILICIVQYQEIKIQMTVWFDQSIKARKSDYYSKILSEKHSLYELKLFNSISYIKDKWIKNENDMLKEKLKANFKSQKYSIISGLILISFIGGLMITLFNGVVNKFFSIGVFVAVIGSVSSFINSTDSFVWLLSSIGESSKQLSYFDSFMELPEISDNRELKEIKNVDIEFKDVVFSYPNTDKKILDGVSFKVRLNERVSLVGENGAGKSTIIKLLCKLYRPDSGEILVDGNNINDLSQSQLRDIYGIIFQDYCNYSLTLRENVAFGDIKKINDDEAIKKALKMGMADDIKQDLDTPLGKLEQNGVDLSGGQWQRLAISRACIGDSKFVILDEPTASLDPLSECEMYKTFSNMLINKGCIMISHRLASAKMCDKIVVLSDGKVEEIGTHNELLNKQGLYSKMWIAQSEWYKEDK